MQLHKHDPERFCRILEEENESLREQIIALKKLLISERTMPFEFCLTESETVILNMLLKKQCASKEDLLTAISFGKSFEEEPEIKIIDVFICKMRQKLARFNIAINTKWGSGYYLTPETKQHINTLINHSE